MEPKGLFVPSADEIQKKLRELLPDVAQLVSQLLTDHTITVTIERKGGPSDRPIKTPLPDQP